MKKTTIIQYSLGQSNENREENDFYATDPKAINELLTKQTPTNPWEPAAGMGHLSKRLEEFGYNVRISDLIDRGIGAEIIDFLKYDGEWDGDIITNPPFCKWREFVYKAMELLKPGRKLFLFLKIQSLESIKSRKLFEVYNPKYIYIFSRRIAAAREGKVEYFKKFGFSFIWVVWEKNFSGETILDWIN